MIWTFVFEKGSAKRKQVLFGGEAFCSAGHSTSLWAGRGMFLKKYKISPQFGDQKTSGTLYSEKEQRGGSYETSNHFRQYFIQEDETGCFSPHHCGSSFSGRNIESRVYRSLRTGNFRTAVQRASGLRSCIVQISSNFGRQQVEVPN